MTTELPIAGDGDDGGFLLQIDGDGGSLLQIDGDRGFRTKIYGDGLSVRRVSDGDGGGGNDRPDAGKGDDSDDR